MATYSQLRNIDPDDEAQLLDTIDRWVEREVKPIAKDYDHADRYPTETVEQMKELGLFGATVSPEYGGLGLPAGTYAKIVMRISRDWMAVTGIFNSHLMLALCDREVRHRRPEGDVAAASLPAARCAAAWP